MTNKNEGFSRRELLQSLALALAAPGMLTPEIAAASATPAGFTPDDSYPPARTGLRGTHVGAFEAAHQLRDGMLDRPIQESGQHYDLVIVGGGISGLSAAWLYRQQQPTARILILDNHDDFGGHAKRNEFHINGEMHLMNGGTLSIQSPRPYSKVADDVLKSVGIDAQRLNTRIQNRQFYPRHGLTQGFFFDSATFGRDALIRKTPKHSWQQLLATAPLGPQTKKDIIRIEEAHIDYLPDLSPAEKKQRLSSLSYRDFLLTLVKADPETVKFYQQRTHGEYCIGIDAVSALDCWGLGFPGFQGMGLPPGSIPRMGPTAAGFADTGGSVDVHLPDGGATVARSLVRALIPAAIPGRKIEDLMTAHVDYSLLDQKDNPTRIRLNSIVTRVQNISQPGQADMARVEYLNGTEGYAVTATHAILACWNMLIPFLCPELPQAQKTALASLVKAPLIYASVAIKNWHAFEKLGVERIHSPGGFFADVWLNEWVSLGHYHNPHAASEPIIVHMVHTPCAPGQNGTDQLRIGRAKMLATTLEEYQQQIRQQLNAMLGSAGFDANSDILAMTVNRWPHGYAFEYDPMLSEPPVAGKEPYVIGRQRFGAIAIANSDSGGQAYMDSAINQAHRAVTELLS